jgi:hypothetical protein
MRYLRRSLANLRFRLAGFCFFHASSAASVASDLSATLDRVPHEVNDLTHFSTCYALALAFAVELWPQANLVRNLIQQKWHGAILPFGPLQRTGPQVLELSPEAS